MSARLDTEIIGDGHVHLHRCYHRRVFLDTAYTNLALIGCGGTLSKDQKLCLALTESANERAFEELFGLAHGSSAATDGEDLLPWRVEPTNEEVSVVVTDGDRFMAIVAGSQVAAREHLEVLVIGRRERVPDGLPIREILDRTAGDSVVRVIPWGAGKWLFARGALVESLVREHGDPSLFLGDEAGRPGFWPRSALFQRASAFGVRDLPGSDPLPFASDVHKVGRMGFRVQAAWDAQAPAASLVRALHNPQTAIPRFARLEPLHRFVVNQFKMQLWKRRRRRQPANPN